jgi:hypothetical protein
MRPRTAGVLLVLALLCAGGGCGAPTPGPTVQPASQQPGSAVPSASTGTTGTTAPDEDLGVTVGDLHQLDWDAAPVPPGFCGVPTVTVMSGGKATTTSGTWGPVTVAVLGVDYGDLLADDADEAALRVYCDNGGGTGSSTLAYGIAVYAGRGGRLVSLGVLTAQMQEANQLPTLLSVQEWRQGSLVVAESYYRDADSTCCPSGTAETTWTWTGDVPSPSAPHVLS